MRTRGKPPAKTSRAKEFLEINAGKLERTKRFIAAGVKLFFLKRGIPNEGRDL